MTTPQEPSVWSLVLVFLVMAWAIGCQSPGPAPTPVPTPQPSDDFTELSLLCERAIFASAQARVAECEVCWEDFQSAYDVLDFLLDQDTITLQDLVNALNCTKLQRLSGPDGQILITADNVFIQIGAQTSVSASPITPELIPPVAMACWVGLNKWRAGTPR